MAELGPAVPESGPRAEYRCPVCDDELNRLNQFGFPMPVNPELIYCGRCLNVIMPALTVLRSSPDGFGTDAI